MGEIEFASVDKYFFLQHQKTIKELVAAIFKQKKTLERVHALKNISFKKNVLLILGEDISTVAIA